MELIDAIPQDVTEATARRVEGQRGWIVASTLVGAAMLLAQLALTARRLGPADFGVLAIVVAVPTIIRSLIAPRTRNVVQRYFTDALVDRDFEYAGAAVKAAALLEIVFGLVALAVTVAVAPYAAELFTGEAIDAKRIVMYSAIIPFSMTVNTALGVLQYFGRFDIEMVVRAAERVAALAATIGALIVGGSMEAFITAAAIGPCVGGVLLSVLAASEARKRLGAQWHLAPMSAMKGRSSRLWRGFFRANFGNSIGLTASREGDPLFCAWLGNPMMAGHYALASALASVLIVPTAPFVHAVYPDVARLASHSRWKEVRSFTTKSAALVGGYAALMLLIFNVTGPDLVSELFGRPFVASMGALLVLLAAFGIEATAVWVRPVLAAAGLTPISMFASVVIAGVKLSLVFYLLPIYGIKGCAAATAAGMLLAAALLALRAASAAKLRDTVVS